MTISAITQNEMVGAVENLPTAPYQPVSRRNFRLTGMGSLAVGQVEPSLFDLAREGKIFVASPGVVANAIAPVQDVPTTAAAYALFNNAAVGSGLYLAVLRVWAHQASGTPGINMALLVGLSSTVQAAAVANGTGVVVASTSASQNTVYGRLGVSVTLAGAAAWQTVASNLQTAAVGLGSAVAADLNGAILIPPQFAMGMTVLSATGTTAKYGCGAMFAQVKAEAI